MKSTARSGGSGTTALVAVLPLHGTTGGPAVLPLELAFSRTVQSGFFSFGLDVFAILISLLSSYAITGAGKKASGSHTKRVAKCARSGKDQVEEDEPEVIPEKTTRR